MNLGCFFHKDKSVSIHINALAIHRFSVDLRATLNSVVHHKRGALSELEMAVLKLKA